MPCGPRRERLGGHRGALDARANLGERGLAGGGGVVGEWREPAIVGGPELIDRDVACRFKDAIADELGRLDRRVDRRHHPDEHPLIGLEMPADDLEHVDPIALAGQRHVEVPHLQLEQARQQLRIVDIGTVRRIAIAARTGVHAEPVPIFDGEPRQRQVVQVDEAVQQLPRRVDLHRQPAFGEIDLHLVGTRRQAAADFRLVLGEQIVDEGFAGIAGNALRGIHQAERRRRDHRLLDRPVRIAFRHGQVRIRVAPVSERSLGQPRHPARMTGGKGDLEAVRRRVREPVNGIGPEIVIFPLFSVRNHRRAGRFELPDGVADGVVVERLETGIVVTDPFDGVDQRGGTGQAADGLGWNHGVGPLVRR